MKRKNKFLLLFLILLFGAIFIGCNSTEEMSDEEILKSFIRYDLQFYNMDHIDKDLNLQTSYTYKDKNIQATWSSSNTKILANDGTYYPCKTDNIVDLEMVLVLNETTLTETFSFTVYASSMNEILAKAYQSLDIPSATSDSLNLPTNIQYGTTVVNFVYNSSDENILSNAGIIGLLENDTEVNVTITVSSAQNRVSFDKTITVLALDKNDLKKELSNLNITNEYEEDIELPNRLEYKGHTLDLNWSSSNHDVLKDNGKIIPQANPVNAELTVSTIYNISHTFDIVIMPMSNELCFQYALEEVYIPAIINNDIRLQTEFGYGVTGTWKTTESIITSSGKVIENTNPTYQATKLYLTLQKGGETLEQEYSAIVGKEKHMFIDRCFNGEKNNLEIQNGKLVLTDGAKEGTYSTGEISNGNFTECVGSFSCITFRYATCELQVRLKINNKWSSYFTYGAWGRGLKNACYPKTDTYSKMVEDEIKTTGSNVATAFELKVTLRRDNVNVESPKLSLIALSLDLSSYSFPVDITGISNEVKWNVPKLYQREVPEIGGSICSPTSSTMLLKFKGHSFANLTGDDYELSSDIPTNQTAYEHGYIANIAKDYGNDIFGNWAYCCITMGAYGENAYVKRYYSENELLLHLANVGPIAASIKGYVINGVKDYNTAGHLMVVTGYAIRNGKIFYYINDPNVPSVSVEMTSENFFNIWRNVGYVIE